MACSRASGCAGGASGIDAGSAVDRSGRLTSPGHLVSLDQALAIAYRHLNRRERTVAEMRAHLRARGLEDVVVGAALDELTAQRYLDDVRYARLFVQDKRQLAGWGRERLRRDLVTRGIERDVVEAVLADADQEDELERAIALLRRRLSGVPATGREQQRALGILLRKGYDREVALQAVSALARR